jgi:hypothetical protein
MFDKNFMHNQVSVGIGVITTYLQDPEKGENSRYSFNMILIPAHTACPTTDTITADFYPVNQTQEIVTFEVTQGDSSLLR